MTITSPADASEAQPSAVPLTLELVWDKATTPLEAIERGLYSLADQATGETADAGTSWIVTLYPRSAQANRDGLAHQMRQHVTDHALRVRIAERTDPLRNLVFAMAFSRSPQPTSPDAGEEPEVQES